MTDYEEYSACCGERVIEARKMGNLYRVICTGCHSSWLEKAEDWESDTGQESPQEEQCEQEEARSESSTPEPSRRTIPSGFQHFLGRAAAKILVKLVGEAAEDLGMTEQELLLLLSRLWVDTEDK